MRCDFMKQNNTDYSRLKPSRWRRSSTHKIYSLYTVRHGFYILCIGQLKFAFTKMQNHYEYDNVINLRLKKNTSNAPVFMYTYPEPIHSCILFSFIVIPYMQGEWRQKFRTSITGTCNWGQWTEWRQCLEFANQYVNELSRPVKNKLTTWPRDGRRCMQSVYNK